MSAPVARLVLGLNAKRSGKGWIAKCPAHEDHKPSLTVDEGTDGRALVKCFGGCSTERVLAALGLTVRDLFPDPQPSRTISSATPPSPRLKVNQTKEKTFVWRPCVEAFTDKHIEQIARWRGYSPEFVRELRDKEQIGIHNGLVAFPVHNNGTVVGTHFRLKDGTWNYAPVGIKTAPFVFGDLIPGERVNVFESTWDGLDYLDKSGERDGVIIARGGQCGTRCRSHSTRLDMLCVDAKRQTWRGL